MTENQKDALNVSSLKDRGWTDAAIRKFLGEPDFTRTNPHYYSAAPMRFYQCDRIEKVEASDEYQQWSERSAIRKATALKAADKKRKEMTDWARNIPISIPAIQKDKLTELAIDDYNSLWAERGKDKKAYAIDPPAFLNRLRVNYLRHSESDYESLLNKTFGKVGVADAYDIIKERILDEIARIYPELGHECIEQTTRLYNIQVFA